MHIDSRTGILYLNMSISDSSIHDYSDLVFRVLPGSSVATAIIGLRFGDPGNITTDSQGRVIVSMTHGVGVYCANPWRRCRFLAFDSQPQALAYDPTYDHLYVRSAVNQEVLIYDYSTGKQVGGFNPGFDLRSMIVSPVLP